MISVAQVKRDLIAHLDERRSATRAFIETLSPTLPVHTDSNWTVRDLVIHLTAIEVDMIRALQCAIAREPFSVDLRGQPSVPGLYELRRRDRADTSWQDLLADWERVRDRLRGVVLAFPPELMETPFSNPFFQDYSLIDALRACGVHEARHLAEMRAAVGDV